jgi:dephospho-CoA kinase
LRKKIFGNPTKKQWLESLLHPLIVKNISSQLQSSSSPYTILVAPLLIESQQTIFCDRLLVIDTTKSNQIERTTKRDESDNALVEQIIASQLSSQQRLAAADDVIENNTGVDQLHYEVNQLHPTYIELAAKKSTE